MEEFVYDGKTFYMKDKLEPGEMELDMLVEYSNDDTIDLSDQLVESNNDLEDTLSDLEVDNYE